jgi:hypothetical protein
MQIRDIEFHEVEVDRAPRVTARLVNGGVSISVVKTNGVWWFVKPDGATKSHLPYEYANELQRKVFPAKERKVT